MTQDVHSIDAYIGGIRPRFEQMLGEMVEIPSVSMDPARAGDVRRMATYAADLLRGLGAEARIVETQGHPIVSGGWITDKNHQTVTIYNHMDVQPAQEPQWKQRPFEFQNESGIYRGRGATDDKGPALTALLAAKHAVEQGTPIN
ncbi:MAG TPA: M20/M25/M40 family metallo-hydrolase, partial [Nitrospiraceae bacterium]|nr:M20/M25/M40 family metallo-hydrolase [Nitrospiraceae bacterium]